MASLTPQAYVYLRHPILSSGETMLYHTLQHLCFTGALKVHFAEVQVGKRRRPMTRLFLSRGTAIAPGARSEAFAWRLIPADKAITLVDLRRLIEEQVEDHELFKYEEMLPDLQDAGLLRGRHGRMPAGVEACRTTRDRLFTVQQDIGRSLEGGWERSLKHVQALGSCIVLLNEDTQKELKAASPRRSDLVAVFSILRYLEMTLGGAADGSGMFVGGFGGTGGGFGGGGGGGFGGFGGGSFGGGGAGGSW